MWLEEWYLKQCDDSWEHGEGIKIVTLDNPGWKIKIDLTHILGINFNLSPKMSDLSDQDWFMYEIKEGFFIGRGDPSKLIFLINEFKKIVER